MYNIILTVTTYIVILYRETTIMELHHTIILHNQVWLDKSEKLIGNYITYNYLGLNKDDKIYIYISTSAVYNLVCLIDHASFINFDTSIWQCFITKINLSDNDSV